ncbi:MAG: cytochrome C oxidase subunit IV family protein [Chloroflexi bacterium]|nr:cytochrome C oxidase subunit IV family protein [Chloroflexota bacterium]
MNMQSARQKQAMQRGLWVIVALVTLTVVDFLIATQIPHGNLVYLAVFAFVEAGVILYYFMHITQLWRSHEEEEE